MKNNNPVIYCIKNLSNGMEYVGQTNNFYKRISEHKKRLFNGIHQNKHLQNAWNFYGKNNFIFEILESCQIKDLTERECFFIKYKNTKHPNGYNLTDGGEEMINPTACVRKKMSDNAKQRFSNPNNHPFFGKKHTQESIEKNRISNLEHPITQEMREKQKQNTPKGEQCHSAKLTVSDIPKIKDMLKNISIKETANLYGVSYTCIWEIQKGRTWLNDPA